MASFRQAFAIALRTIQREWAQRAALPAVKRGPPLSANSVRFSFASSTSRSQHYNTNTISVGFPRKLIEF